MADVRLNFSSQWPSVQVVRVLDDSTPMVNYKGMEVYEHNLGFPPFAIQYTSDGGMYNLPVDDSHVVPVATSQGYTTVIFNIDISSGVEYSSISESFGDVLDSSGSDIDLRNFLLHSRAVSPMILACKVGDFPTNSSIVTYESPLDYPVFMFAWMRYTDNGEAVIGRPSGMWFATQLSQQSWPGFTYNGYSGRLDAAGDSNGPFVDKGAILSIRNPAVVTRNQVSVTHDG